MMRRTEQPLVTKWELSSIESLIAKAVKQSGQSPEKAALEIAINPSVPRKALISATASSKAAH
jgi:hypothetical protein